jgi:hypothetical protein
MSLQPAQKPASQSPEALLEGFLRKFAPEVAHLARACLEKMRHRLPTAHQLVYDNYNALAIGFAPSDKASHAIFSIAVFPRWVSLFFLHGATLNDPEKVLKGKGHQARHIVLKSAEDLDLPAVKNLISAALQQAKESLPASGHGTLIIKSVAAKQRPRRPVT